MFFHRNGPPAYPVPLGAYQSVLREGLFFLTYCDDAYDVGDDEDEDDLGDNDDGFDDCNCDYSANDSDAMIRSNHNHNHIITTTIQIT